MCKFLFFVCVAMCWTSMTHCSQDDLFRFGLAAQHADFSNLSISSRFPKTKKKPPRPPTTTELTDAIFPRTDPKLIGLLYKMLKAIDDVFTEHDIPYWIDGGTALGALRHQGCIPWDDDADLVFHIEDLDRILALKGEFAAYGFHLEQGDILRLFPSKNQRYPYVDLAGYRLFNDNVYRFDLQSARIYFYNTFYWLAEEVDTLVRVPFGPLMLNAPNDMLRYVLTGYGSDCLTHATYQTHHGGNRQVIKEKVRIVDFSPAEYCD